MAKSVPATPLPKLTVEHTSLLDNTSVWSPGRAWLESPKCSTQVGAEEQPPLELLSEPFISTDIKDSKVHRDGDGEVEVDSGSDSNCESDALSFTFRWRRFWRFIGPGFLMSLAYLDPGNLEANLQSGAYTGLRLTWVLWWATVLGLVMQETAARLALVTGYDLAQTVRAQYPRWLTYVIYVMMELAVISADIQEVVGSSIALLLLSNGWVPLWLGCIITGLDTFTFLAVQYLGVRYLELFIGLLIGAMTVCFSLNWLQTGTDTSELLYGWAIPAIPSIGAVQLAVGTLGSTVQPHNLFLHSGLVLSRKVPRTSSRRINDAIWYMRIEATVALLLSFYINLAVVATNDAKFYSPTCARLPDGPFACLPKSSGVAIAGVECSAGHTLDGGVAAGVCGELGLLAEGYALRDKLGRASLYVWAAGLLAAGQASTMVCTYAGQIIMGGCLEISLAPWKRVALTRTLALAPALVVAVYTAPDPALFSNINEYLNILQSIQLPFAVLPVLRFASTEKIMGQFRTRPALLVATYAIAVFLIGVNLYLVIHFVEGMSTPLVGVLAIWGVLYLAVCARMVWH